MKADNTPKQPPAKKCQLVSEAGTGRGWMLSVSLQETCVPADHLDFGLAVSRAVGA